MASEIVRHNGTVVCAAVSPYSATRDQVRAMMREERFILVYVDTPRTVCEERDVKGLYAKALRGEVKGFTGVDDPYEAPIGPEVTLTTSNCSPEDNAKIIIKYLLDKGFLVDEESTT